MGKFWFCYYLKQYHQNWSRYTSKLLLSKLLMQRRRNKENLYFRFWWFYLSVNSLVFVSIGKIYQTHETLFYRLSKYFEFRQKYSAARRIFNSLLGVWIFRWNTVSRVWYTLLTRLYELSFVQGELPFGQRELRISAS